MACGRAAVVTDSGGMAEMVEPGRSGLVAPAGSAEALSEAIGRLVEDEGRARTMGAAARRRVLDEYGLDTATVRILNHYREVIGA